MALAVAGAVGGASLRSCFKNSIAFADRPARYSRKPAFSEASVELGFLQITGQSLWVYAGSLALVGALYLCFERTRYGKALRATAINRIGARLSGISATAAGKASGMFGPKEGGATK